MSLEPIDSELLKEIEGAESVVSWFGRWPTFHDGEVIELSLIRNGVSRLRVHTWNMTNRTYERAGDRYFVLEKHAVVTFELEEVDGLKLLGFNHQNVLSSIDLEHDQGVFRLTLGDCHGVSGQIEAKRIRVSLTPGEPVNE